MTRLQWPPCMAVTSLASHTVTPGLGPARRIESHPSAPCSLHAERESEGRSRGLWLGWRACSPAAPARRARPRARGAMRAPKPTAAPRWRVTSLAYAVASPASLARHAGPRSCSCRASVLRSLPVHGPFLRPPPCLPRSHTPAPAPVHALRHPHPHMHAGTAEGGWKGGGGQWVTEGGRGGYLSTS